MRKKAMIVGLFLFVAVLANSSAWAADTESAWHGFWNSVGGAVSKVMPWNWGK